MNNIRAKTNVNCAEDKIVSLQLTKSEAEEVLKLIKEIRKKEGS